VSINGADAIVVLAAAHTDDKSIEPTRRLEGSLLKQHMMSDAADHQSFVMMVFRMILNAGNWLFEKLSVLSGKCTVLRDIVGWEIGPISARDAGKVSPMVRPPL